MFLDKLTILVSGKTLREIPFKKGINFILDETVTTKTTESGNSVGKTTVLRVIDFCLGSDGDDIYKDQEFERPDQKILNYLNDKSVTAVLEATIDSKPITLTRSFGEQALFKIDDVEYSNVSDYRKALEIRIFDIVDSRPTLRQLMPKFIRKDSDGMSRAVRYAHSATTQNDYELIYSYFFDFPEIAIAKERHQLKKDIKKIRDRAKALKNGVTLPALRQAVAVIAREIGTLEKKKETFELDEAYDSQFEELNRLKKRNASVARDIASLETEIQMHNETLKELRESASTVSQHAIAEMYKEAQAYVVDLDKDFNELLEFHNQLVQNKIQFVEESLNEKAEQLKALSSELGTNLKAETHLLQILSKEGALSGVELLYSELMKRYEEKGRREKLIEDIEAAEGEQKALETKLENLGERYQLALSTFQENLEVFNSYFSQYAKDLYDENFIFTYDDSGPTLKFFIDNIDGNVGSGKKKATITAFDFAFIAYFIEKGKKLPRFVLHDGIEDITDNQIRTLFRLAEALDGQYVVSLIKDRLVGLNLDPEFIKKNRVLALSQSDRFFKLD